MPPIDRSSDRAVYRQIADELRAAIDTGEIAPGGRLPSENELVERHGVNRRTVQRAFQLLIAERRVRSEFGVGHFVRGTVPTRRLAGDRFKRAHREAGVAAFTADMNAAGKDYDTARDVEVVEIATRPAPVAIAERLGLSDVDDVVLRDRRYLVDGQPVQVAVSYVPADIAAGTAITERDSGPGGIYARIEEAGFRLTRFVEDVSAEIPDEATARWLGLPAGAAVLRVVRTAFAGNRAVEVCDGLLHPEAFTLSYTLPAD